MVGRRPAEHSRLLVEDLRDRTAGRLMNLMTSDELLAYAEVIREVYGEEGRPARSGRPGRQLTWAVRRRTLATRARL